MLHKGFLNAKTTRRWFLCFLVAWGGIEPPTQGFSTHVAPKKSMFMGLAAGFRATCYKTCDSKTTQKSTHQLLYHTCVFLTSSFTLVTLWGCAVSLN
jgi:hypothetical protein